MTVAAKRRWHSFSLRTLFFAVTALGCWLGWTVNFVRERQALLPEIEIENKAWDRIHRKVLHTGGYSMFGILVHAGPMMPAQIPFVRKILGDKPCAQIECRSEAAATKLARWFPEANIAYYDRDKNPPAVQSWIDEEFPSDQRALQRDDR